MKQLNNLIFNNIQQYIDTEEVFISKSYGNFVIRGYKNSCHVLVEFLTTGYTTYFSLSNIKRGEVKDKLLPNIYGVGYVGSKYKTRINNKATPQYLLWKRMLERCYCTVKLAKNPTYVGCSVSDNFKSYEYFYEWCNAQVGFGNEGWQLDKDLLVKGNKIYSEDTCCFLPEDVNKALTRSDKTRGSSLIGVTKRGSSYYASISIRGKTKPLGSFKSETLAFEAYCKNKEEYLSVLAIQYENQIDRRAYQKLIHYKVDIHD